MSLELHTYWRSSAAYRVRIALNIKQLEADHKFVHLVKDGGQQHKPSYLKLNPQGRVPTLVHNGMPFTQSIAIIEYLDELHPNPALLPEDMKDRAWVRSLSSMIACDVHPLNNLGVLDYLKTEFGADEAAVKRWYQHWIVEGFSALEKRLAADARPGSFCYGDHVTMADLFLVPQVYNAERFDVDMSQFEMISAIAANCRTLDAFIKAAPEHQADAS
ncbi:MAG: maleylacetoacetate isomerase [Gammaproteobacteria bacterium]|nr:maleylacetoacetate isomerase [Gammaproteobacteria bacterium]